MRQYKNIITLSKNERGIWDLDTSKGCSSGMELQPKGCYQDCYAARSAKIYGIDFSKTILRDFKHLLHQRQIINKINKIDMPFLRMGCSGDPSENWQHTFLILEKIKSVNKEIVIITKHWNLITAAQLNDLGKYKVCINTSVSALDLPMQLQKCLMQYERLKPYCKSVLRVVSCDFNKENATGFIFSKIQDNIFKHNSIIDTVFRPSKNNELVSKGIIKVKKVKFLNGMQLGSKFNKKTYLGKCGSCIEKCGVFDEKLRQKPFFQQLNLFKK